MKLLGDIFKAVLAVLVWLFVALDTLIVFLFIALLTPFDKDEKITHQIAIIWGRSILRLNPFWDLELKGVDHIQKNTPYVLVANHVSLADIVCLYCLGTHFKWVAKASLFRIPVFGWTMSLLNYIPLTRGRHGSIRKTFQDARDWIERGVSVLIFPEGTRSRSGNLGEFKNGAFKLALLTHTPIVPVVIEGTGDVLSKGKAAMASQVKGSINVLPPVGVAEFMPDNYQALKTKVRELMSDELAAKRKLKSGL